MRLGDLLALLFIGSSLLLLAYLSVGAVVVRSVLGLVKRRLASRGEIAEVPEEAPDEQLVAKPKPRPVPRGVTVPPADGSHDKLPEDKTTADTFWAIAKTAGIEADR